MPLTYVSVKYLIQGYSDGNIIFFTYIIIQVDGLYGLKHIYIIAGIMLYVQLCMHCKEAIPKIRNKYSQTRNCKASVPNFHIHVFVSDLFIPTIDLPFLLQKIYGPILEIYKSPTDT